MKNIGCGNCQHFLYEDIGGNGWCEKINKLTYCGGECPQYKTKQYENSFT